MYASLLLLSVLSRLATGTGEQISDVNNIVGEVPGHRSHLAAGGHFGSLVYEIGIPELRWLSGHFSPTKSESVLSSWLLGTACRNHGRCSPLRLPPIPVDIDAIPSCISTTVRT